MARALKRGGLPSRKLRVLVLCHEAVVPEAGRSALSEEEYHLKKQAVDVSDGLRALGHEVVVLGVTDELNSIRQAQESLQPQVVFNLLEEFQDKVVYDAYVASYLELSKVPYTGCNPRGLFLARDKALSKKILSYHRIRVPKFAVFPLGRPVRRPRELPFPLIVKSLIAEASEGIAQASIVHNDETLEHRVKFVHAHVGTDAVAEQFIDGRELYVGVLGNQRLQVLPTWELFLENMPDSSHRIATERVKWDLAYQKKYRIDAGPARDLEPSFEGRIAALARRICRALHVDGYARIDFRLSSEGELYFLETNPNPSIGVDEELSGAAAHAGMSYEALLQKVLTFAQRRVPG